LKKPEKPRHVGLRTESEGKEATHFSRSQDERKGRANHQEQTEEQERPHRDGNQQIARNSVTPSKIDHFDAKGIRSQENRRKNSSEARRGEEKKLGARRRLQKNERKKKHAPRRERFDRAQYVNQAATKMHELSREGVLLEKKHQVIGERNSNR